MAQLNKYQKEIESLLNKSEKDVSKELKALYDDLIKEVTAETIKLQKEIEADDKFSKKLQKERLDSIRSQMQVKSDQLAGKQHDSMFKFLKGDALTAYNELFYDFEMSNKVPLTFSLLPDKQITTIINTPVAGRKLSTRLKGNSSKMKQNMNSVLSRGFSQGWSTQKMAVQIQETGGSTYRRAMTIARTESGRVTSVTRQQSQNHAKELNIEFDKQWISTLDLKTRSDHRELDGQIVGVDEYFKVSGYKALQPHMFGVAAEDCNCRCRTISKLKGYDIKQRRDNESHKVIDYKNYDEWFADKYPKNVEDIVTPEAIEGKIADIKTKLIKLEDDEWDDWGDIDEEQAEEIYDKLDDELYELSKELEELLQKLSGKDKMYLMEKDDDEDPLKFFKKNSNYNTWVDNLTDYQKEVISDYSGASYSAMNEVMRYGEEAYLNNPLYRGTPMEYKERMVREAKELPKMLDGFQTDYSFETYRAISGAFDLSTLQSIETLDTGFMSTSLDKGVLNSFAEGDNNVFFTIKINKGSQVGAYIQELSQHQAEREFLIKPNTKFKVISTKEEKAKFGVNQFIELEAIG